MDLVVNNINDLAFVYENTAHPSNNNYLRVQLEYPNHTILGTKLTTTCDQQTQFIELSNTRGMYSTSEAIGHFGVGDCKTVHLKVEWSDGTIQRFDQIATNQIFKVVYAKTVERSSSTSSNKTLFSNANSLGFQHKENELSLIHI